MNIDTKVILEYSKDLNVLYVEDDDMLRNSSQKIFSNYFKQVDLAFDGQDGLEKYLEFYKTTNTYYDLIITDINMPNMDGILMSQNIINENPNQAIIFISAYNEIKYLQSAIKVGAKGFLNKPLDANQLKDLLYKTCQSICDRRMAECYYQSMEESNILLIEEKDTSINSKKKVVFVKDIIDDIQLHKEEITKKWVNSDGASEKLHQHTIDEEFFRTHYAIKVLEYFIGVIKGDNQVGNCPVIVTMLEFLKHKNLPLESIFIICVNFKNTMTSFVFEKYTFNHELFDELSLILDKNFEGVICNYMQMKDNTLESTVNIIETPLNQSTQEEKEEEVVEVIDYCDYVFEHDIYELQDLETEIENMAITVTMNTQKNLNDFLFLGEKVSRYGSLLMSYPIFKDLGNYIFKLGNSFSDNAELLFEDNERMSNISILIEGFVNDLMMWRREVFENNIADSNFLNASFFSNVDTIIQYIEYDESAEVSLDDEIEFF